MKLKLSVAIVVAIILAFFVSMKVIAEEVVDTEIGDNLYAGSTKAVKNLYEDPSDVYSNTLYAGSTEAIMNLHNTATTTAKSQTKKKSSKKKEKVKTKVEKKKFELLDTDYQMYTTTFVNTRSFPDAKDESNKVKVLPVNTLVHVIGEVKDSNFVKIEDNNGEIFVCKKFLSKNKTEIKEKESEPKTSNYSVPSNWTGPKLNRRGGTVQGPSGRETYYNLPMGGVIRICKSQGINGNYWVRNDGVKMYGNYIMVAADLSIRPRGSLVPTSLGMGIVVDTGDFIYNHPTGLDIATAW